MKNRGFVSEMHGGRSTCNHESDSCDFDYEVQGIDVVCIKCIKNCKSWLGKIIWQQLKLFIFNGRKKVAAEHRYSNSV